MVIVNEWQKCKMWVRVYSRQDKENIQRSGRAGGGHRQGRSIPRSFMFFLHAWLGRKHKVSLRSLLEHSAWMNLGGKSCPKKVVYVCVYRISIKYILYFWHVKCILIKKNSFISILYLNLKIFSISYFEYNFEIPFHICISSQIRYTRVFLSQNVATRTWG